MLKLIRRGLTIAFLVVVVGYPVWFALNNPHVNVHYLIGRQPIEIALVWVILGTIVVVAPLAFLAGFLPGTVGKARLARKIRKSRAAVGRYRGGVEDLVRKEYGAARKKLSRIPASDECATIPGRLALAELHLAEGKPQEALAVLGEAKEAAPGDLRVLMMEAAVHRKTGDPRKALDVLRGIVVEQGRSLGVLEEQRDLLVALGEWDEAYRVQRDLLELMPDSDEEAYEREERRLACLRIRYAQTLAAAGRTEDAEEMLKALQKKRKDFAPAALALGEIYASQGREDAALKVLEKGYWSSPSPAVLERIEEIALGSGRTEDVLKLYKNALKEWPEDMLLKLRRAKLSLKLDRADEALAEIEALEKAGIALPELASLKGEAYYKLKRIDQAVEQFRKAQPLAAPGYACEACNAPAPRWDALCPACGRWGSVRGSDERALAGARPRAPAVSAQAGRA